MSHQIRPGARGGRDQFSWDQVKEDKQRLNYLGSSIHGVPDKFKKGPETFWYAKETKSIPEKRTDEVKSEIMSIKEKEKQMMEALLGGRTSKKEREYSHQSVNNEESRVQNDGRRTEHEKNNNNSRDYDNRKYHENRDHHRDHRYREYRDRDYRDHRDHFHSEYRDSSRSSNYGNRSSHFGFRDRSRSPNRRR